MTETNTNEMASESSTLPARTIPLDRLEMRRLVQLDACTRCGECLKWCPVYDQDSRENILPRQKILDFLRIVRSQQSILNTIIENKLAPELAKKWIRKIFRLQEISEDEVRLFALNLYECSTCGQCQVVCPANIDTVNLWENIRELMVSSGYGPLEPQKALAKSVKSYDNPWQQPRQGRVKWARRAKKENLISDLPPDVRKTSAKILLFLGCTAVYDSNIRQIAIDTVNMLKILGIDYGCLGENEKCCGSVLLRMGDPEYERIASDNIKLLNSLSIETLVTSCSGCFKTIKQDYPQVGKLKFEVLHTVEFLHRLIEQRKLKFDVPVEKVITYHDPCHLGRASGVFDEPRAVIRAIPGLELVEMPRHGPYSRCCGAGGGVKAGFPDLQNRMAQARIKEAEQTGAQELVSACPFCYAGLQVGIGALNSPLVMRDMTHLVISALKKGE
ncbi:MAG: (Fe-S)-binding protein [Syntrophaceae bacterium]|nr:(Fe-S)-binding protein [Syntrophaceae bacterium]